jgi:hypothetical protein
MSAPGRRLGAVVAALLLTVAVTWPLVTCLGRCLGPPPDSILSVYFLAWVAHALTTPGVRLFDAPMFAPYPNTLALGDWMPAVAPLAVPVALLTGNPVVAHNVVLVALYTTAALGAGALGGRLLGSRSAGVVAAVAFAYSPRLLDQAYNLQTLGVAFLPWLCLALERYLERPSWGRTVALAVPGLALVLTSPNHLLYAGLPAVTVAVAALAVRDHRVDARALGRLAAVGLVAAALVWGALAPFRRAVAEWGLARSLGEIEGNSLTPAHLLRPPPESLLRHLVGAGGPVGPVDGLVQGLALGGLALAGVAALGRRTPGGAGVLGPYVAAGAVALVLAFGPTLVTPWGALPLPYRALYALAPGGGVARTPARFLFAADLVVAMLAAAGAAWLLRRLASPGLRACGVGLLVLLLLLESLLLPFPGGVPRLDPARLPDGYRWLAGTPPGTVALALPMGDWVNVAASAFHLRRTVNGWSSFTPPLYGDLVAAMERFPDPRSLALVRGLRPDVVLVDREWLTPERSAALAAPESGLRAERVFRSHVVYRVAAPAPPGVESLEVQAVDGPVCVTLRNPGPEFVPLYPAHRLRLEAITGAERSLMAVTWLPLDLAPGARHTTCAPRTGSADALRGTIESGARRFRFVAEPGRAAARPTLDEGP